MKVVIEVPKKRQITSLVDVFPFTARLRDQSNGLIVLDDKIRSWLENNALDIRVVSDGMYARRRKFRRPRLTEKAGKEEVCSKYNGMST